MCRFLWLVSTVSFLKAIKKSSTYPMLMFSQQEYMMWTSLCQRADFGKQVNWNAWYCIHLWHKCLKCWNDYPWTLTVQESVCRVGPKDVNVQPGGTSALIWIGTKHIPRVNSDLWWDMGSLLHSESKQSSMMLQGLSTAQWIEDTAVNWQDHGKCVLGLRRCDSCWFSSTWHNNY
jgi:hypothetical protein